MPNRSYSRYVLHFANSKRSSSSKKVRSRWAITVRVASPPCSWKIRSISLGAAAFRPGWMMTGVCVWDCAMADARMLRFSTSVKGHEQPTSPIIPGLMFVSSMPLLISETIIWNGKWFGVRVAKSAQSSSEQNFQSLQTLLKML